MKPTIKTLSTIWCAVIAVTLAMTLVSNTAKAEGLMLSIGKDISALDVDVALRPTYDTYVGKHLNADLGTRVGWDLNGWIPFVGLDYASVSYTGDDESCTYHYDPATGNESRDCSSQQRTADFSLFTLQVGTRLQLGTVAAERATPYAVASLFTVIPSSSATNSNNLEDTAKDIEKISSYGVLAGYGIEYFFARSFAVGAEVGASYFYGSTDESNQSLDQLQLYASVRLTLFTGRTRSTPHSSPPTAPATRTPAVEPAPVEVPSADPLQ